MEYFVGFVDWGGGDSDELEPGAEVAGAVGVLEEAEDVGGDEVLHFGVFGGYFAVFGC